MQIVRDIPAVRAAVAAARREGRRIGFVPTMGALHAGHLSLIDAARRDDGTFVVVSIFVNPTQFGPNEDYERYPRDDAHDFEQCRDAGVALVFNPSTEAMYAADAHTSIHVASLTDTLCGPHRPGHFDGVATVVAKLFNIVQPDVAYFGKKDAQQLAIIRRMVRDLDLPVEIVGCPLVREPDGLAMSSRNRGLSSEERERALAINRALRDAAASFRSGERDAKRLETAMHATLTDAGIDSIDYASVVDADSLQPLPQIDRRALFAIAAHVGATRLIDNVEVDPSARHG